MAFAIGFVCAIGFALGAGLALATGILPVQRWQAESGTGILPVQGFRNQKRLEVLSESFGLSA